MSFCQCFFKERGRRYGQRGADEREVCGAEIKKPAFYYASPMCGI